MVGKVDITISDNVKHTGDVTCLAFHNNYLYSSGSDGLIKIWSKDLQLIKDVPAHGAHIYTIAINPNGCAYSSSCDGTTKYFPNLLQSIDGETIYRNDCDDIISICCPDSSTVYLGDDKGVVHKFVDNNICLQYNLVEEVKSMSVDNDFLYTVRDLDTIVTHLMPGKTGRYTTRAALPGRAPLALIGPIDNDGMHKFLVFTTRDGKGVTLIRNIRNWPVVWTKDNAHELIINALCGTHDRLYTAGYDGIVKKWVELDNNATISGEIETGTCINHICNGLENTVYVGDSAGLIRRVHFSSTAA